jgi:2-polyprenyl-3-methyl-5-hydroxy-6-metoxy-1,4-benzoquinol methylase
MDDPEAELELLHATYRQFSTVNRWIARWPTLYRRWMRPVFRELSGGEDRGLPGCERGPVLTVLDVGCGGGDLAWLLGHLAARDGFRVEVTGIDPDPRAFRFARDQAAGGGPPGVRGAAGSVSFRNARAETLARAGERFDVVVSNHVLHHLPEGEVSSFMETVASLTRHRALVADIERSLPAWHLFGALTRLPGFRGSFVREDGLVSIRRSFTWEELQDLVPPGWRVTRVAPFRLVARWDAAGRLDEAGPPRPSRHGAP